MTFADLIRENNERIEAMMNHFYNWCERQVQRGRINRIRDQVPSVADCHCGGRCHPEPPVVPACTCNFTWEEMDAAASPWHRKGCPQGSTER